MTRTLSLIAILFLFTQCASKKMSLDSMWSAQYDEHFISSGDNFPEISLLDNNRYKFLIGLHNGYSPSELQSKLNWNNQQLTEEINLLEKNGYLKRTGENYFPTISLIMQKEGKKIFRQTEKTASKIVQSIIEQKPIIEAKYRDMDISKKHTFAELSFFILSDVLLDNWQINNVEREFLKEERTLRHGKRYYIQYAEKDPTSNLEVFGIYGNQYNCNKQFCFITYGNNRHNHFKTNEELMKMEIPLLSKRDQNILDEMAELYKPTLINILEQNRARFIREYEKSVFKNEISFEEHFIWYYHFLYTKVTDQLAQKGELVIPETGIFRVKLER